MAIFSKTKMILAKMETVYGTDPTPTGVANAMLMSNVTFTPMEGEDLSREIERPFLAAQEMVPVGLRGKLSGKVELVPSGAAGTAPSWAPLLRACGIAQTIVANTSVIYNPISESMESLTLYFHQGGTLHKLTGCRGNVTLNFPAQGFATAEFEITGLWSTPAEAVRPTPDYSAFKDPIVVTHSNTPTFTVNGIPLVMRETVLAVNNQVEARLLVGSETIEIPDRSELLSAKVEAVPMTTFNPYALAQAQTKMPVSLVHGTAAGKTATLALPKCQLKRLSGLDEQQNIVEWPLELVPLPTTGNDQWTLTLT